MKCCKKCRRELPPESFGINRALAGGRSHMCLDCTRERGRAYRAANRAAGNERAGRWRKRNREKARIAERRWRLANKERKNQNSRLWRERNQRKSREMHRRGSRKFRYGITEAAYTKILTDHNGRCGVCGAATWDVAIDHCHGSGRVRGLLCRTCNLGLGHFNDDPQLLVAAIRYLHDRRRTDYRIAEG